MLFTQNATTVLTSDTPVWQVASVYPGEHLQVYRFTPSIHVPPFSQGLLLHSFMSTRLNIFVWRKHDWLQKVQKQLTRLHKNETSSKKRIVNISRRITTLDILRQFQSSEYPNDMQSSLDPLHLISVHMRMDHIPPELYWNKYTTQSICKNWHIHRLTRLSLAAVLVAIYSKTLLYCLFACFHLYSIF